MAPRLSACEVTPMNERVQDRDLTVVYIYIPNSNSDYTLLLESWEWVQEGSPHIGGYCITGGLEGQYDLKGHGREEPPARSEHKWCSALSVLVTVCA